MIIEKGVVKVEYVRNNRKDALYPYRKKRSSWTLPSYNSEEDIREGCSW